MHSGAARSLLRDLCLGVIAAYYVLKRIRKVRNTVMEGLIAIVETNNCFADGIQMVTTCTLGNNSLVFRDFGKAAIGLRVRDGRSLRLSSRPEASDLLINKNPEAQALYLSFVNNRKATPEEEDRMMELSQIYCFEILRMPPERLFQVDEVTVEISSYSYVLESRLCARCSEKVMKTKVVRNEATSTAGVVVAHKELNWTGIVLVNEKNQA